MILTGLREYYILAFASPRPDNDSETDSILTLINTATFTAFSTAGKWKRSTYENGLL